jgi:hypothetical protein
MIKKTIAKRIVTLLFGLDYKITKKTPEAYNLAIKVSKEPFMWLCWYVDRLEKLSDKEIKVLMNELKEMEKH